MFVPNMVTGALFVRGWLRLGGTLLLSPFSRAMARAAAADPRLPGMVLWLLPFHRWDVRAVIAASPRCPRRCWPGAALVRSAARTEEPGKAAQLLAQMGQALRREADGRKRVTGDLVDYGL